MVSDREVNAGDLHSSAEQGHEQPAHSVSS